MNDDPLDLFDDDGDGVNEMCLLFDEDNKNQQEWMLCCTINNRIILVNGGIRYS